MKSRNADKILLILDIDETLIHTTSQKLEYNPDFTVFDYPVYKRPFLEEFLISVAKDFHLAVWSSASDDYVEKIVEVIFPKEIKLHFVWGRGRCTYRRNLNIDEYGYYSDNYFDHYHYIKPLKKVKRK
ncbi:MAG: HAD family hydrolase, partial [Bacteroidota bacterium]